LIGLGGTSVTLISCRTDNTEGGENVAKGTGMRKEKKKPKQKKK